MSDHELLFKFIMIGDSSTPFSYVDVGKSCLLLRFLQNRFKSQHEPTLGVEFGSKVCLIKNKPIKIQIWDTAGQQSFKSITRAYYKGSIVALLVYDITSQSSFTNLKHWLFELRNNSHSKMKIALIGNKSDLNKERQVSMQSAQAFIKEHNIAHYYEASAMTGINVEKLFFEMGEEVLQEIQRGGINVHLDTAYGVKFGKKGKQKYPHGHISIGDTVIKPHYEAEKCKC